MAERPTTSELPLAVRRMLDAVRRRIRAYVWLEGLATVIITLGVAFWLGIAADWLFEPSPAVRRVGLIAAAFIALYVCYRYLLRRIFVPISDTSAAVLLERRFPALRDHVITAVDVASTPAHATSYHPDLIAETNQAAGTAIAAVNPRDLFNRRPLVRSLVAAAALVTSLVVFAILSRDVFGFWLHASPSATPLGLAVSTWKSSASRQLPPVSAPTSWLKTTISNSSSTPATTATKSLKKSKSAIVSPTAAAVEIR